MSEIVLVAWVSFNSDPYERSRRGDYQLYQGEPRPGPLLELLGNEHSRYRGHVSRVCLFSREGPEDERRGREVAPREQDVLNDLKTELERRLPDVPVEVKVWKTAAPPIAHRELFHFTVDQLVAIRRAHKKATLLILLSPGTPQMQTVMLLALQARFGGEPVEVVQGIPRDKRASPGDLFHQVPWNLLADLYASRAPEGLGDEARWSIMSAKSKPLQDVAQLVNRYGNVPFPVLILGSRGTGKTEVARLIREKHFEYGVRAVPPDWHRVNCATLRGDLLRSELFGHEKGAFTGASKQHSGVLERAAGDCVFLDEIHQLDGDAQAQLLLALERGGTFRRIGGAKLIEARFRLIAASNVSREELRRKLQPDFYDRVGDLIIEVPDLHACDADLDAMWTQVARDACREAAGLRFQSDQVSPEARRMLEELRLYQNSITRGLGELRLPGNWRDLQRLARRLLASGLSARHPWAFSLSPASVAEELTKLRKEEESGAGPIAGDQGDLLDELPTLARCEQALRSIQAAGETIEGSQLLHEWESRLCDAALRVSGSGRKAAQLLQMKERTFNDRRARRPNCK